MSALPRRPVRKRFVIQSFLNQFPVEEANEIAFGVQALSASEVGNDIAAAWNYEDYEDGVTV